MLKETAIFRRKLFLKVHPSKHADLKLAHWWRGRAKQKDHSKHVFYWRAEVGLGSVSLRWKKPTERRPPWLKAFFPRSPSSCGSQNAAIFLLVEVKGRPGHVRATETMTSDFNFIIYFFILCTAGSLCWPPSAYFIGNLIQDLNWL